MNTNRFALSAPLFLVLAACAASAPAPATPAAREATVDDLPSANDQDATLQRYEVAIRRDPSNAKLHVEFAAYLNAHHIRGAAAHLDAARPLAGGDYALVVTIGHEYRLAGEFESCVATFGQAIGQRDGAEARTERALCKVGLHDDKGADADLHAAVAADPAFPQAHYFLAGRLATAKHLKEAAAEYQAYLSLAPEGSLAEQATEKLRMVQQAEGQGPTQGALASSKKPAK